MESKTYKDELKRKSMRELLDDLKECEWAIRLEDPEIEREMTLIELYESFTPSERRELRQEILKLMAEEIEKQRLEVPVRYDKEG
jgi:hypothetical protein